MLNILYSNWGLYFFILFMFFNVGCSGESLSMEDGDQKKESCCDSGSVNNFLEGNNSFLSYTNWVGNLKKIAISTFSSVKQYFVKNNSLDRARYHVNDTAKLFAVIDFWFRQLMGEDKFLCNSINDIIYNFYTSNCSRCGCFYDADMCYCCCEFSSYNFSRPLDCYKKFCVVKTFESFGEKEVTRVFSIGPNKFAAGFDDGTIRMYDLVDNNFSSDSSDNFIEYELSNGHYSDIKYVAPIGLGLIVSISSRKIIRFWRFNKSFSSTIKSRYIVLSNPYVDTLMDVNSFRVNRYGVFSYGTLCGMVNIVGINSNGQCGVINSFKAYCNCHVPFVIPVSNKLTCSASSYGSIKFWERVNKKHVCKGSIDSKLLLNVFIMDNDVICSTHDSMQVWKKQCEGKNYKLSSNLSNTTNSSCVCRIASDAFVSTSYQNKVMVWKRTQKKDVKSNNQYDIKNSNQNKDYENVDILCSHSNPVLSVIALQNNMLVTSSKSKINIWLAK